MINVLKKLVGKRNFSSVDFVTLKTAMMLAALDGDVSPDELASFREMASGCNGCTPQSFDKLWDEALRCAGFLLIQSKMLSSEKLVELFVREAKNSFVCEVLAGKTAQQFADEINGSDAVKARYLKAPDEVVTTSAYRSYFSAVPIGDAKVSFELNASGTNELVSSANAMTKSIDLASITALMSGGVTNLTLTGGIAGFYYSLYNGTAVTNLSADANAENLNVLCGAEGKIVFPW